MEKLANAFRIIRASPSVFSGFLRLWDVLKGVWLYDLVRPGIRTGFQHKSDSLSESSMWYSPVETATARKMVSFAREWVRSYFEYSSTDSVAIFVDLGGGAGKANLIALELGFSLSVAMEIDEELVELAKINFRVLEKLRRSTGIGIAVHGDVTNPDDLRRMRNEAEEHILGKAIWVFFNKNSYGATQLEKSVEALDDIFKDYVYLYQNPVHEKILIKHGFFIHRRIIDRKLKKNKDWIIATPDRV